VPAVATGLEVKVLFTGLSLGHLLPRATLFLGDGYVLHLADALCRWRLWKGMRKAELAR
jgi:hypothetical protein